MGIIPYHKLILSHIFWCFNRNQADLLWQAAKSDTYWQKPYPESTYRVPGFRSQPCTVQSSYSWNRESPASLHSRFQHEHSVHLSFYSILIGFVFTDDCGQISNLLFYLSNRKTSISEFHFNSSKNSFSAVTQTEMQSASVLPCCTPHHPCSGLSHPPGIFSYQSP